MKQECCRCVMDTSAPDIMFGADGHCNFCSELAAAMETPRPAAALDPLIQKIQAQGRGKPYDCIVGVSGGVDSSYTLHLAKAHGLRPLAVHLDNGWNSEESVNNIAALVRSLNVDLYTHVIDWRENKDLQRAMFAAHVVDIEMLMDNAMQATNYAQARKYGLRYILSGSNRATEGMRMPRGWTHCKLDARNIRAIHRRFGSVPIRTHPLISTLGFAWNRLVRRIQWVSFLDYVDYQKDAAVDCLVREHGYKPYPYKHYESVFTRFYQAYILPRKFGIDKRRAHLSTLIMAGQMTRAEAAERLLEDPYPDPKLKQQDLVFVRKKLGFTEAEFAAYLDAPPIPHRAYPSEEPRFRLMVRLGRAAGLDR